MRFECDGLPSGFLVLRPAREFANSCMRARKFVLYRFLMDKFLETVFNRIVNVKIVLKFKSIYNKLVGPFLIYLLKY